MPSLRCNAPTVAWCGSANPTSSLFCAEPARHPTLTHEVLDQLPPGRTTDYMRNLLVEHGVLPSRDERLARFQSWAVTAQQRITTEAHRKLVARFIRWSLEKRLRSMSPVTDSAFLRAKQTVTVTIEFCNWLAAEHNGTVEQVTQGARLQECAVEVAASQLGPRCRSSRTFHSRRCDDSDDQGVR
jgi:hypothetical protein